MSALTETIRRRFSKTPASGAAVGFLVVFLFFAVSTPSTFLSHGSFSSILSSQAVPGIAAIGITLLMISGEFDLSVGSILGVSSLVFLYSAVSGVPILVAGCLGILSGGLLGLVNGLLLVTTRIPSFIVTLGTMLIYRAISLTSISGGRIVRYADYSRQDPTLSIPGILIILLAVVLAIVVLWTAIPTLRRGLAGGRTAFTVAAGAAFLTGCILLDILSVYGLSPLSQIDVNLFKTLNGRIETGARSNYRTSILWWLGLTGIFAFILFRTRFGNAIFATGGNAEAARTQGIAIDRVRVANFVISGGLAAIAGIIQVARLKSVDPLRGEGLELEIIASVVIGGTLLSGGFGSVIGSAIGTALTGMLRTGLVLISIPSNAFRGAIGGIMIVAVIINAYSRRDQS
ncbi:MAG: ABC transporter permease [Candidatus Latescibacterota bacterium]|nr:ABC transporter permease [Candidatus Latescibacterota bacterium]